MECISPMHVHVLEPGEHRFEVRAIDQATPDPATWTSRRPSTTWTIDLTLADDGATGADSIAPDTRIAERARRPTSTSSAATFRFAGSDNLDAGPEPHVRVPARRRRRFEPVRQPDGLRQPRGHRARRRRSTRSRCARSTARATPTRRRRPTRGRSSRRRPTRRAPDTTIDPSARTRSRCATAATFTFSQRGPDRDVRVRARRRGACDGLHVAARRYTGLAASATHKFRVRAIDLAGNVDPTPASYTWTVGAAPVPRNVFCGQVMTQSITRQERPRPTASGTASSSARPASRSTSTATRSTARASAPASATTATTTSRSRNGTVSEFDFGVMLNPGTDAATSSRS